VSRREQLAVTITRVSHRDALHDPAKRLIGDLDEKMQVIGHPAKCVDASAKRLNDFGDDLVECVSVSSGSKKRFAMIATEHDVVAPTRDVKSRKSGHPCTMDKVEMTAARVEQEMTQ